MLGALLVLAIIAVMVYVASSLLTRIYCYDNHFFTRLALHPLLLYAALMLVLGLLFLTLSFTGWAFTEIELGDNSIN